MKISVIGANSFIARNLIFYIKQNYKNYELKLYGYQTTHADGETNYHQINIVDINSLQAIDFDVDIIFIFAGQTGTLKGFDEYNNYIDINEKGLLNLLTEYRKQHSTAKIIFPSSRLVYKGAEKPLQETDEKEFKTIYAINKFSCEQYLKMYNSMYDIPYTIFRICVPYGTMVPNASSYGTAEFMLNRAQNGQDITLYGNGEYRRTITHMEDLCAALLQGACSDDCTNDIFNIGGEDYSLKEMAQQIATRYGVNVSYVEWPQEALKIESGSTVFDSSKLDSKINFKYQHKFAETINGD